MEEPTSWKNHSFTLMIFGGIVLLSSIFFVLGMLLGRTQGQQIAEQAFAERAAAKPAAETADDFKLNFYAETTGDKPELKLEPPPPAPKQASISAPAPAQARSKPSGKASATPVAAKPPERGTFLQVFATKNQKQVNEELKRVQSKGFPAMIVTVTADNAQWHRVYVGPYKDSEVKLRTSDLHAKGYKEVIIRK